MAKILIVEDDKDINEMLTKLFIAKKYEVKNAYSGTEALLVHDNTIDLILLDLMLPGKNGEEIIQKLKKIKDVPVIVISAISDIDKKLDLFNLGANDYVTKPFYNDELLARVKNWLECKIDPIHNTLKFKDIILYEDQFLVECNGQEVNLTKKEFEILKLLMENKNITVTKSFILDVVWDDYSGDENTLNVHMSKIKNKLKECNPREEYIETVWSIGYRLKKN